MRRLIKLGATGILVLAVSALAQMAAPTHVMQWGREGSGDGQFNAPEALAVDKDSNVYVADTENHRIQKFDANGEFLRKWGSKGLGNGQFESPGGIAIDKEGNVYVADSFNHRIQKFDLNGKFLSKWGSLCDLYGHNPFTKEAGKGCVDLDGAGPLAKGDGQFSIPVGIAVSEDGSLYIADAFNHRVQKFKLVQPCPAGTARVVPGVCFVAKWGSPGTGDGQFDVATGIAIDKDGNVYVSDNRNHRVQKFDPSGKFLAKVGGPGDALDQMRRPYHLAVDGANRLYVTDQSHHRIQIFDAAGKLLVAWGQEGSGPGQFKFPKGVAVHQNFIYIADSDNHRVQKFRVR